MKKFLINGFLFSSTTIFFYMAGLLLWGAVMPDDLKKNLNYRVGASGFTYTRLHEVGQYGNVNVLFVGSSHAYRGFDTRIFKQHGYTSFNLGSSSQTPLQTEMLLDKYLDKLKPSTIVFEVYPYIFSSDGVESSVDMISNDDIDLNTLKMVVRTNNLKTYNTLAYGFLHRLFTTEKPVQEKRSAVIQKINAKLYNSYISGGFMECRKEMMTDSNVQKINTAKLKQENKKGIITDIQIIQTREGKWDPRSYQLRAFDRMLKKLKEKNIRVILVQAPINSEYYAMIKCNKEIDAYFSSKGEYYNFNELMKFDNELDFADYDHLNEDGVKKMNEALIEKAFKKN